MPTIEEDLDYIISTLVDHDCPFEARAALTRIRADRKHLEEGGRVLVASHELGLIRDTAYGAALDRWLKAECARQSGKGG